MVRSRIVLLSITSKNLSKRAIFEKSEDSLPDTRRMRIITISRPLAFPVVRVFVFNIAFSSSPSKRNYSTTKKLWNVIWSHDQRKDAQPKYILLRLS
eukprot:g46303.t1